VIAVARLIIVEDHPLVAQGLRALLEPDHDVVGIVHDPMKVVQTIDRVDPDVVLLDLSMPKRNGLELLPELRRRYPELKLLVVTMHVDRALADMSLKAGADGFVSKESTAKELRVAIEAVLKGDRYLSPRVPRRAYRASSVNGNPSLDRLTPRQLQILKLLGEGKAGIEIAEELHLSPRTIEFHRAGIRRQLGIASEFGLVRFAIVAGLAARGGAAWKDPRSGDGLGG
jgi:DNA-binding NarL/FixJ family response regulator